MVDFNSKLNEVKDAESSFNFAQKQREELNEEHRKKLTDYYEKIAIYCASAISFTVTLLGFLFNNKDILPIYRSLFLSQPIIFFIYGWTRFMFSILVIIFTLKKGKFLNQKGSTL